MRILVVDDEVKTAAYLAKGLTEHNYVVDTCGTGPEGLNEAIATAYDLMILDVMLPGMSGFQVLKELRVRGNNTLTLMLTAKDGLEDRIKGLDIGADAYLVKPFSFSELLAVIRSLLRRGPTRQSDVIVITDLSVDLVNRVATRAGKRIDLTPKEFTLLAFLARRHGDVMSRTIISEHVWDMQFDSETNVVDVHIRRLRSKIDDPYGHKLIHTVRGVGYVLRHQSGENIDHAPDDAMGTHS